MSSGQTSFSERAILLNGAGFLARSSGGLGPASTLSVSDARTLMGAQASDATLTALAGVTVSADQLIYATGSDTFATASLTSFARSILDDADASAVRTTIGAQATLVSGGNIRTINGNSLLGSTDLTISGGSGSPGGSTTQLQFNSSGVFAGSSRLTWGETPGLGLVSPVSGQILQISPPSGAAYTHNVPFVIVSGVADNTIGGLAADVSEYNFGVNFGFNLSAGGGLSNPEHPALGHYYESNYITNRRGFNERLVEMHLIYVPSVTTTNTTAGSQIRFMSTEILTGENAMTGAAQAATAASIVSYWTVSNFGIRAPVTAHTEEMFNVIPGQTNIGDGTGNRLTIGVGGGLIQYSASGVYTHLFNAAVQVPSFTCIGTTQIQSLDAASALVVYGGITAGGEIYSNAQGLKSTKSVTANNSFALYAYATYGTPTTEPAGLTGAIIQIVKINGSNLELHAKGPTGATVLLATLAAS